MKFLLFTIGTLLFTATFANDIDKLYTNEDVQHFLVKKVNRDFKDESPFTGIKFRFDRVAKPRNTFYKIDLDNNGRTDLVIDGVRMLLIILDKGGLGKCESHVLDQDSFAPTTLIGIDSISNPVKLIVKRNLLSEKIDSLVYKFNGFIEYNPNPNKTENFKLIKFKTSSCLGQCPAFELTIDRFGNATYNAISFNPELGMFAGTLSPAQLRKLTNMLRYIPFEKLKDKYRVDWTDDQTVTLEVETTQYNKAIEDYGRLGSWGLGVFYNYLLIVRDQVDWR